MHPSTLGAASKRAEGAQARRSFGRGACEPFLTRHIHHPEPGARSPNRAGYTSIYRLYLEGYTSDRAGYTSILSARILSLLPNKLGKSASHSSRTNVWKGAAQGSRFGVPGVGLWTASRTWRSKQSLVPEQGSITVTKPNVTKVTEQGSIANQGPCAGSRVLSLRFGAWAYLQGSATRLPRQHIPETRHNTRPCHTPSHAPRPATSSLEPGALNRKPSEQDIIRNEATSKHRHTILYADRDLVSCMPNLSTLNHTATSRRRQTSIACAARVGADREWSLVVPY